MTTKFCIVAPVICGSSVRNLFRVTLLAGILARCLHDFCKMCALVLKPLLCVVPSANHGRACNMKSSLWCVAAFSADSSCASDHTIVHMLVFYSRYQNCCEDTKTWTGVLCGIGHTTRHNWIRAIPIIIIVIVARSLFT
jgi:hypothetical protein